MSETTFEALIVDRVMSVYKFVNTKKYKSKDSIKAILTFNLLLYEIDPELAVVNELERYTDLLTLCISGFIKYDDETFSFLEYFDNEFSKTKARIYYMISIALLIAIEYKEFGNFYKAILNENNNAKYLEQVIIDCINNSNVEEEFVEDEVLKFFYNKSIIFYKNIIESDKLLK